MIYFSEDIITNIIFIYRRYYKIKKKLHNI